MKKNKTIRVAYLARVEGEGAILVKIKGHQVAEAQVKIFEPPRFFEAFLRGRYYHEAPDLTARICGICPVAYQVSASQAMEQALEVSLPQPLHDLRRLLYCGEWIASHALHIFFLHAPDFLGYEDAVQMARDHGDMVKLGLDLKKVGNELVRCLGGREIHPISVRVGGLYRLPAQAELTSLLDRLKWAREAAVTTVGWVRTFPFPDFEQDYEFVALRHPEEYPIAAGRLVSNRGLDIGVEEFPQHFLEEQAPHSHALHSRRRHGGAYLVGPLARYSLNFHRLTPLSQETAREAGLGTVCRNPFKSIIVRSIETLYAVEEALRLITSYEPPPVASVPITVKAGVGHGISEAPRGILYHRYRLNPQGIIDEAVIVPPTSQNQKCMENDLYQFTSRHLHLPDDRLTYLCEQTIRNYDPCISCATHCLKVQLQRE